MSRVAHSIADGQNRSRDVFNDENVNVDFASLLLSPAVQAGLESAGFEKPSPIQLKAIPLGRCGLDLIVQAKSGTGKTCVFSVIALESLDVQSNSTQVLVLAPTREIAVQIQEVIHSIGSAMTELRCHVFIGGTMIGPDRQKLKKCHIAVGTPGRIKQLIEFELLKTESLRLFVLDEADKLLDHKFKEQVNWIYHKLTENKQMLALSATYPEYLAQQLTQYMRDPVFVRLNRKDLALHGIKQYYKVVAGHRLPNKAFEVKVEHLLHILSHVAFTQCLVFSNLQTRAQNLSDMLNFKGWPSTYISGSQEQAHRLSAMAMLKKFQCRILISTDLTARGIDAENVNLIINLDVPFDIKTYFHRIGRAGRFGTQGAAITLASAGQEEVQLTNIKKQCHGKMVPLPDTLPSDLVTQNQTPKDLGYSASSDSDEDNLDESNQLESYHNLNQADKCTTSARSQESHSQNRNTNGMGLNVIHQARKTSKLTAKKPGIDVGCQATPNHLMGIIGIDALDFKIPSLSMYRVQRSDHWTYEKAKRDFEIFLDPSKASSLVNLPQEKTDGEQSSVHEECNQEPENIPVQKPEESEPNDQQVLSKDLEETSDESKEIDERCVHEVQTSSLELNGHVHCKISDQKQASTMNTPCNNASSEESAHHTQQGLIHTVDQEGPKISPTSVPQVNSQLPNAAVAAPLPDSNEQNHGISDADVATSASTSASLKNDHCKGKDTNGKQIHQKIGIRRLHMKTLSVGQMLQQLQAKLPEDKLQAGDNLSGGRDPVWEMYRQYLPNSSKNTDVVDSNRNKTSNSENSSAGSSDSSSDTQDNSGTGSESESSSEDGDSESESESELDSKSQSESESDEETESVEDEAAGQCNGDLQYSERDYDNQISEGINDMTFNQYGNTYDQNSYDHWDSNPMTMWQNYADSYSQYYHAPYHGYYQSPYQQGYNFGEHGNWYNMY
ncbi:uncharacterized protein [Amphiura filiformis]|uniref:uncharacterized protein n=1 Tax=Amphiura filiformis TaxID=82378 RepID=UPI003B20DDD8